MTTLAQERIKKGLCPRCGEEAAPYRECYQCRLKRRVARMLDSGTRRGIFVCTGEGRNRAYQVGPNQYDGRWATPFTSETDRRFRPRLAGVPVDVEAQIMALASRFERPFTIEEVLEAWGRLRSERKRGSVIADMRALIDAQRRREARAAKRMKVAS